MNIIVLLVLFLALLPVNANSEVNSTHHSQYAGQEKRQIKSLSQDDVEQLLAGKGWGLARAAELNGMPGPLHILQMKKEIALSHEQEAKIQKLYGEMKQQAIPLGKQFVRLEKELNEAFANKSISRQLLANKLTQIAEVRKQLRFVHLAAHLETPAILTTKQIDLYNRLRGYDNNNPCENIPHGHDIQMWKKHNGCQ